MGTGAQSLTFLALLLPFLGAAVAPLLCKALKHNAAWPLALVLRQSCSDA
jgi:multicomponent Na+:H+ antiporter subunit A